MTSNEWLRCKLRNGPVRSLDLLWEARAAGFSGMIVMEAAGRLDVIRYREGKVWWWKLPEPERSAFSKIASQMMRLMRRTTPARLLGAGAPATLALTQGVQVMPHDIKGRPIAVGDDVVIAGKVTEVNPGDEYCNVKVQTNEPMYPSANKTSITLNTKQVEVTTPPKPAA